MLKKTQIAVLVYVVATLQVLGYAGKMWAETSYFAKWLALQFTLSPATVHSLNLASIGLMTLAILWVFFKWSSAPFVILGLLFFLEALGRTLIGGDLASSLAVSSEAARYLWLFAVAYALELQRRFDHDRSFPLVAVLFQAGIGLTFVTQGLEAIALDSKFFHTLTDAARNLFGLALTGREGESLLIVIGAIDIFCGLRVLWKPERGLLSWLTFWGLLTAAARFAINPQLGYLEAMARSPHVGLPLLILLLKDPRASPRIRLFNYGRLLPRGRIS